MDVKVTGEKFPKMAPPDAKWNTKNLIPRLATDATAAIASAVTVAPLITIIDKYVYTASSRCNLQTPDFKGYEAILPAITSRIYGRLFLDPI